MILMKNTKLLLIPLFAIFLLGVISAASITTSLFYDSTTGDSLTIIDGNSFGIVVSADSVFEGSMTIVVDLLDSNGNLVKNLLNVLKKLVDKGNTVLVVEHNLDIIKNADWVIDLGPEGGEKGGYIVAQGTPADLMKAKGSYTGKYLKELKNGE